jgi:fumarate hydratase class I
MKTLTYPFTEEQVRALSVGDRVSLSGQVVTGRDRLHRFLFEGGASPVSLRDGCVYHCGPVVVRGGRDWEVLAAGPTTSMRQDPYTPALLEKLGIRVLIGKGGMGEATRRACRACGCVYIQATGGAAALLASRVRAVTGVHFIREFGMAEAMWVLQVENLEGVVTMDARGSSLHRRVEAASRRALRDLLAAPKEEAGRA